MKLSVSAIAWNADEESRALAILAEHRVRFIEHVPARAAQALAEIQSFKLEFVAFQALLFGTSGLHLFQSDEQRAGLEQHLYGLCEQAGSLGARALVFGSPKNRFIDERLYDRAAAFSLALDFFRRVGKVAESHACFVCLEPNPEAYGCNFLCSTQEAAEFVRQVDSPGIKLNVDAGALAMNGEDCTVIFERYAPLIGHLHISEPHLAPVGSLTATLDSHRRLASTLRMQNYEGIVSIEMLRPSDRAWETALAEAIGFVRNVYGAE